MRLQVGDSVAVRFVNVWNPQKLATFSGICIARRGGILRASFTLRNHIDGYAMEQQFPLNSPLLRGIRVIKVRALRVQRAQPRQHTCVHARARVLMKAGNRNR